MPPSFQITTSDAAISTSDRGQHAPVQRAAVCTGASAPAEMPTRTRPSSTAPTASRSLRLRRAFSSGTATSAVTASEQFTMACTANSGSFSSATRFAASPTASRPSPATNGSCDRTLISSRGSTPAPAVSLVRAAPIACSTVAVP